MHARFAATSARVVARGVEWSAATVFAAALAGCAPSFFTCADADDCAGGRGTGTCEPNGWCSFPDDTCASGSRYGELAGGGFAGECVETTDTDGAGTDTFDPSSTLGTTTSATTASPTAATLTSDGSSTGDSEPVCGNGELDDGEACDDANTTPRDGCSELCLPSGSLVWQQSIERGRGTASELGLWSDGDLMVGFVVTLESTASPGVWRVEPEAGEVVWGTQLDVTSDGDSLLTDVDVRAAPDSEDAYALVVNASMMGGSSSLFSITADGVPTLEFGASDRTWTAIARQPTGDGYLAGVNESGEGFVQELRGGSMGPGEEFIGEPFMPSGGLPLDILLDGDVTYVVGMRLGMPDPPAFFAATAGNISIDHDFMPGTGNVARVLARDPAGGRLWVGGAALGFGGWVAGVSRAGIDVEPLRVTGPDIGSVFAVAADVDGSIVAVGTEGAGGEGDGRVARIASTGEIVWSGMYPTPGDDGLQGVAIAQDGAIFICGSRDEGDGPRPWFARIVP